MINLHKILRQAFPDFPGASIDYIIYRTRVDESNKWREENKKLQARVAKLEDERDSMEQRNVELSVLAHNWMVCHDRSKAGLPYDFPAPADVPELKARVAALEAERDWWEKRACQSNKRLHPGSYLRYLATTTD